MATTTADKKPTLDEVVAELAAIKPEFERLKALGANPDFTKVRHVSADGQSESYFEEGAEIVSVTLPGQGMGNQLKSLRKQHSKDMKFLKSVGYKNDQFSDMGDFVRFGMANRERRDIITDTLQKMYKPLSEYENAHKNVKAIQGMSTVVGADGGFTIMPEFAPGFIDRIYSNNLFSMTDNYTVSGNNMTFNATAETSRATGSRGGGIQGYWLGQGDTLTKSKPTTRQITMNLHKLGIVVYLTDELLADSGMALQQFITRKVAEEFNFMVGDSLINGDGNAKPLGIMNFPSLIGISKETGQQAATLQTENIAKMYSRFYAPNLGNAIWLKNQDIGPQLNLMTLGIGAAGVVTYMPPGGVSGKPYDTLMGLPMMPTEFNATLGTSGDLLLADMGQILSISKGGIAQAVSMHVEFLTDQLAIRFIMRLNAGPWENAAITPYKGTANTQSNFIALNTRS